MTVTSWKEVSKANPCLACGKPDYCRISLDGGAMMCNREASPPDGWVEIKKSKEGKPIFAKNTENKKPIRPKQIRNWVYEDRNGRLLVRVTRQDFGDGTRKNKAYGYSKLIAED